jgi:hypothetical protein
MGEQTCPALPTPPTYPPDVDDDDAKSVFLGAFKAEMKGYQS